MKQVIFGTLLLALVTLVAGCDTAIEGSYKSYTPESSAGVLWPSPDASDAQPAGYRQAPTTAPATMPGDRVE